MARWYDRYGKLVGQIWQNPFVKGKQKDFAMILRRLIRFPLYIKIIKTMFVAKKNKYGRGFMVGQTWQKNR